MRKAINLTVKLYVEGEAPPAQDFAKTTSQALRDIISVGHLRHPHLKLTVKSIVEDTDADADDKGATTSSTPAGDTPGAKSAKS
jgi:hypothetical protein